MRTPPLRILAAAAVVLAARGALEQARAALEAKRRGASSAALAAAAARVTQAEIAVAQAEAARDALVLRAPFGGVVASVTPRVGEAAAAGAAIVTVARLDDLQLETKDLDEVSAAKVQVGQDVTVVVAVLEKRSLPGKVVGIAPQPTLTQGATSTTRRRWC